MAGFKNILLLLLTLGLTTGVFSAVQMKSGEPKIEAATFNRTGQETAPMIRFTPAQALMDEPITIRLSGLPPKKPLIVKARMLLLGKTWQSQATFIADEHGRVDLGKQAPTGGSYPGVDPMGLFWSMTPDAAQTTPEQKADVKVSDPVVTSFDVEMEGRTVASASLTRWWAKPGVRVTEVRQDGLVGKFFEPQQQGRHPAVLVLSGSEGGIKELDAALLASRGYAAFALAYFGTE
ncbi:MAG: acyl-CoA thioesterase/BAAT N-terminal domain-containing protein, partial [Pyrinomonadaceae bacterium]|nr:acyl-CoA thioesterase/BAAT N-terminal domain-containing protein [Pyrinomonadaceae bacterium]